MQAPLQGFGTCKCSRHGIDNVSRRWVTEAGVDARQLAAIPDLRDPCAPDPRLDDGDVVLVLAEARAPDARAHGAVRVGRLDGTAPAPALQPQPLPDGDALHRLRHRDRLPLPPGRAAPRARLVRVRGARLLRPDPPRRLRLHLAQGSLELVTPRG